MVKQIVTKLTITKKRGRRKGAVYRSPRIYLSTKLTDDSRFPFLEEEPLKVEIVGNGLLVSKARLRGRRGMKRAQRRR